MNKLACISLAVLVTACATDDSFGLDDLPPYEGDGGGGKGDDPNCTDETYRTFIKSYLPTVFALGTPLEGEALAAAKQAAADNPCRSGNDASYRIWSYVTNQQLQPLLDAYGPAIHTRFSNPHSTADSVVTAGTLDARQRATLQALSLVRPTHAGAVGLASWITDLYGPALPLAVRAVGNMTFDQRPNEITVFEEEWLAMVESWAPTVDVPAFAAWWTVAGPVAARIRTDQIGLTSTQLELDHAMMDRLAATRPDTTLDADNRAFQIEITTPIAAELARPLNVAYDQAAVHFAPSGGGLESYKIWASAFVDSAPRLNSGLALLDDKRAVMAALVAARPCASGPEVDEIVGRIRTALADAGDDGGGTSLADDAAPIACTP